MIKKEDGGASTNQKDAKIPAIQDSPSRRLHGKRPVSVPNSDAVVSSNDDAYTSAAAVSYTDDAPAAPKKRRLQRLPSKA